MKSMMADFKKVIENEPSLTSDGVNSLYFIKTSKKIPLEEAKEQLSQQRETFLSQFDEFELCCAWLAKFKKVKTPQYSSYYLKHVVEKLGGKYVSNGALIAAALHLGIPTKFFSDSPNINVAISKKCPYIKEAGHVA